MKTLLTLSTLCFLCATLGSTQVYAMTLSSDGSSTDEEIPAVKPTQSKDVEQNLPDDRVYAPQLVYKIEHPMLGKNEVTVDYSYLYGDKYLTTQGFMIEDSYHFSEEWAVGLGVGFYSSGTTSEFDELSQGGAPLGVGSTTPYAYDPTFLTKLTAIYDPFYGKVLFGSGIVHFRFATEFGLCMTKESSVDSGIADDSFSRVGPLLGANLRAYFSNRFSVALGPEFFMQKSADQDDSTSIRKTWLFNLGAGVSF